MNNNKIFPDKNILFEQNAACRFYDKMWSDQDCIVFKVIDYSYGSNLW